MSSLQPPAAEADVGQALVQRRQHAMVIVLDNPASRNALSPSMYGAILAALAQAETDDSVKAILLTGAGTTFCAGGNLNRLLKNRGLPPAVQAASIDQLHALVRRLQAFPKPIIAAVEGAAAGAGLSLALGCDFIVAGRSARFVMAYVKVGLSPDGGGSWFASQALPRQLAAEMMLTGEPMGTERLAACGVVNRVVDDGSALEAALTVAERFDGLSAHAVGRIKKLAMGARQRPLEQQLDLERESFVACLHHPDGGEAIAAFLEKRPAKFSS